MQPIEIPMYEKHEGTVQISGKSQVGKVGKYIVYLVLSKTAVVDVLFIGANAGQQAYKSCSIACSLLEREGVFLGFFPMRFRTNTEKRDMIGATIMKDGSPVYELKDAFVWRLFDATSIRHPKQSPKEIT